MIIKFFQQKIGVLFWSLFIVNIISSFFGKPAVAADEWEKTSRLPEQITPNFSYRNKVTSLGGHSLLFLKAQRMGKIKVIVRVGVPSTPESFLSGKEVQNQRLKISGTQGKLLAHLKRLGRTPSDIHSFKVTPHLSMTIDPETLDDLLATTDVESLEEDIPVPPTLNLSVPRVGGVQLHDEGITGTGIAVAVLDTGVDKNHPFLQNSVLSEACFSTTSSGSGIFSLCPGGVTTSTATGSAMPYGGNCPVGECSHGTHVAGIIAGRSAVNGSPGPGMAPGANIIAIQVFSRFNSDFYCGTGQSPCVLSYTSDQMKGLERVYELRNTFSIASINMSLGGGQYSANCDADSRKGIIDNLRAAGIATVISSGNSGYCGSMGAPACISSAISVGATTDSDLVSSYSNSASFLNLLAPGSSINSSVPLADGGGYQSWNGTSMAAPHVAGAWALMKQNNPTATVTDILNSFTSTGLNITDSKCSSVTKKRINVYQAYHASKLKVASPTFSQPTGTYQESVTVTISCSTSGATIRYTTDGSDPTTSSALYSSALTFTTTTTLKARAFKNAMADSDVAGAAYTVIPTYQVYPSIGYGAGHGTISPGTTQTVIQGFRPTFNVVSSSGYTASVGGTCGGNLSGITFITNPITANCTVIANFTSTATCQDQPVRIVRTNTAYTTLQEAYDAALANDTIQAQAVTLTQNLTVNRNISVTLEGGYPCTYGSNTGNMTTLKGWIKTLAGGGILTIGNLIVKPNAQPPTDTTGSATSVTSSSARINGTVNPRSATTTYYFEWGTTTAYGTKKPLTPASAGKGSDDVAVSADLTGLTPNTTYHYRLVAENSEGSTNGLDATFMTPCLFTVSPSRQIVTFSSGAYSAAVTSNNGCSWTAVSNDDWITVNSGSTGAGNGIIDYSHSANPGKDKRTGTMTIAGKTLTVEQEGAPCNYSLNTSSQSIGAWGGTDSVGVTAVSGCTWTGFSNVSWIGITSGGSGTGNGTVNYSVNANSGTSLRSGTLTIAGQTFTVNQAAGPLTCTGLPVKNMNTGVTYATLQAAYNAAASGHTLQVQSVTLTGNLTVNRNIGVTLEGGYDCGFGYLSGTNTILNGWVKTTSGGGTLTIKNFELE